MYNNNNNIIQNCKLSNTVQPISVYDNKLPWYEQRALEREKHIEYISQKKKIEEKKAKPMFGVTSKGLTKITCYVDKKPIKFERGKRARKIN